MTIVFSFCFPQIEVSCILGGFNSVRRKFPHLVTSKTNPNWKKSDSYNSTANDNIRHNSGRNKNGLNTNLSNKTSVNDNSESSKDSSISRSGSSSSTIPAGGRSRPCSMEINDNARVELSPNDESCHLVNDNR